MKKRTIRAFLVMIVLFIFSYIGASTPTYAGDFVDRDGAKHSWSVGSSHQLVWDGQAYLPFAVVFQPKYLTESPNEKDFEADKANLEAIKHAGIVDILLRPGSSGLSAAPVEAFQRVLDLIESMDMRYEIELYNAPYAPLTGYVIDPVVYRVEHVATPGEYGHKITDAKTTLWVLCDSISGEIKATGTAPVFDETATTSIKTRLDGDLLLFYPLKSITEKSPDWSCTDIWADYDVERDRLVAYMSYVKFGKGLRGFSDPFTRSLGFNGESDALVPISASFRLNYAAWLSKKYESPADMFASWTLNQRELSSYADAARLVPLYRNSRGVQYVYDDTSGKQYPLEGKSSRIWLDFLQFRTESMRGYMDSMSDVVKRSIADVPVSFTAEGLQPLFQATGSIGSDGLIAQSGANLSSSLENVGNVLSLAESASRGMWMQCWIRPSEETFKHKDELFSAVNASRGLGSKGFILDYPRDAVPDASALGWLAEYSALYKNDKYFATWQPHTVFYPQGTNHAQIKRFGSGAWWLPILARGNDLSLGSTLAGYVIANPSVPGGTIYVWSLIGNQTVHLNTQAPVTLLRSSGEEIAIKPQKGQVAIVIGEEPVMVRGIPADQFVPIEVVAKAIKDLEVAVAKVSEKYPSSSIFRSRLAQAKELYKKNRLIAALDIVQSTMTEVKSVLSQMR